MHRSRPRVFRTLLVVLASVASLGALLSTPASATHDELVPVQLVRVNVPTQADRDRLTNLGL
jgi:hypothetical protein